MKKMYGLVALILAGFLVIPALPWSGSRACAQSGSEMSERERQALERKYQEQWDYLERLDKHQESTYERMEEAVKHRDDAEKRKGQAERQLQELEEK
jgi:hypothetical protein